MPSHIALQITPKDLKDYIGTLVYQNPDSGEEGMVCVPLLLLLAPSYLCNGSENVLLHIMRRGRAPPVIPVGFCTRYVFLWLEKVLG